MPASSLPRIFCGASANRPGSLRMPPMDPRLPPLQLTLGLTACALLAGAPAAAQEPPATVGAAGPVYNIEIIVFQDTATLGGAENWSAEAGAGTHSIVAGDESTRRSAEGGRCVAPPHTC